jgi:hypothetical protein
MDEAVLLFENAALSLRREYEGAPVEEIRQASRRAFENLIDIQSANITIGNRRKKISLQPTIWFLEKPSLLVRGSRSVWILTTVNHIS